jgi:hypothetical protein
MPTRLTARAFSSQEHPEMMLGEAIASGRRQGLVFGP